MTELKWIPTQTYAMGSDRHWEAPTFVPTATACDTALLLVGPR